MYDIAFMTYIHNGEKTMRKSIESVLSQESVDLAYYLIDNASTDGTWEIMQEYAAKDSRVRLIQNENSLIRLPEYIKSIRDCEYFAVLDADDWYEPAFAEETIAFMEKEDLDIAAVGTYWHMPAGGIEGYKAERDKVILTQNEFHNQIELFSVYFRSMWAKVFKLSMVREINFSKFGRLAELGVFYAIDTVFCLSAVQACQKIGILDQVMHHYQEGVTSDSYLYHPERFVAVTILLEMWLEMFAREEDNGNFVFIAAIYYYEVCSILQILEKPEIDAVNFLSEIKTIAEFHMTKVITGERTNIPKDFNIKGAILSLMIHKMKGMEKNQKAVAMFYECLKELDAVDLFKSMIKG